MTIIDEIYKQLRKVNDPELNINVVDLGLVYEVKHSEEGDVWITMTLTTPGCPLHDSIVSGVKNAVSSIESIENVDVQLVWSPAWTPELMTDEGRRQLGR